MWILVENAVHNAIGHENWGLYTAMFALGFLFVVVADLGVNSFTTRELASSPGRLTQLYPTLFGFKLVLSLLYPIAMMAIGKWIFGYDDRHLYILFLASLAHAAAQLFAFFRANIQAFQRFKLDAFASVIDRAALLIVTAGLFWWGLDLERFAWARILTTVAAAGWLFWEMRKLVGLQMPALEKDTLRSIVRQSIPFALYTIVYTAHDKVDQVMLERMVGEYETGLYVGAYRWMDAFGMYLWTLLPIFFARFAHQAAFPRKQEALMRFALIVLALPVSIAGLFMVFHGNELLFLFSRSTPDELDTIAACISALGVALIFNGLTSTVSSYLTATNHERQVNRIAIGSVGLNILLNWYLIPRYGAVGSAWATAISYGALDAAYLFYAYRKAPIRIPWTVMFQLALLAGAGAGVYLSAGWVGMPWWISTPAVCLVMASGAWAFGLLRPLIQREEE